MCVAGVHEKPTASSMVSLTNYQTTKTTPCLKRTVQICFC